MLPWMASRFQAPLSIGPMNSHVRPASRERSTWARQPDGESSVLDGLSHVPSGRITGLFLIGPSTGDGRRVGVAPGPAAVRRGLHHAPPRSRRGADLVEQPQRLARRREEHGVPRGMPRAVRLHAVRHLDGCRPAPRFEPRHPDADIGRALARAAEPGGHEAARRHLGDRRCVALRIRGVVVQELAPTGWPDAGPMPGLRAAIRTAAHMQREAGPGATCGSAGNGSSWLLLSLPPHRRRAAAGEADRQDRGRAEDDDEELVERAAPGRRGSTPPLGRVSSRG